jgi:hypothetical protein
VSWKLRRLAETQQADLATSPAALFLSPTDTSTGTFQDLPTISDPCATPGQTCSPPHEQFPAKYTTFSYQLEPFVSAGEAVVKIDFACAPTEADYS